MNNRKGLSALFSVFSFLFDCESGPLRFMTAAHHVGCQARDSVLSIRHGGQTQRPCRTFTTTSRTGGTSPAGILESKAASCLGDNGPSRGRLSHVRPSRSNETLGQSYVSTSLGSSEIQLSTFASNTTVANYTAGFQGSGAIFAGRPSSTLIRTMPDWLGRMQYCWRRK